MLILLMLRARCLDDVTGVVMNDQLYWADIVWIGIVLGLDCIGPILIEPILIG